MNQRSGSYLRGVGDAQGVTWVKKIFKNNQTGKNSKIDINNTSGGPENWVTKLMNHLFQAND